jgi:ADP-ribosyl-[dinitrogen reductase] hydrolase
MSLKDRVSGTLLGLACGDALGRPVEFRSAAQIEREFGQLDAMIGEGTHNQPAGTITDDTALALRIARSLVKQGRFDGADVADQFVEWYQSGPFDIGLMTADALQRIANGTPWEEAGPAVWEDRPEGQNAGNGSIMRCAPYAIAFSEDSEQLVSVSQASSRITHADPRCTYGCAVLNLTLAGLLHDRDTPLTTALDHVRSEAPDELVDALDPIADRQLLEDLQNTGYVVHSLQTALHDGLTSETAADAIVTAVNRGGDTDTIGAIAGAVAGARFGAGELPERWLETINQREELDRLAMQLADFNPE